MTTIDELIEKYPIEVNFPSLTGRYSMLVWKTDNEGSHIVLGRDKDQVVGIWRSMLSDGDFRHAEPIDFFSIEIVRPPRSLYESYAKYRLDSEVEAFRQTLASQVRVLIDDGRPFPPGWRKCENFESIYSHSGPTEGYDECHFSCKNCTEGVTADLKFGDLFVAHEQRFNQLRTRLGYYPKAQGSPRRIVAPEADPARELCYIGNDFGSHCSGTQICVVDPDAMNIATDQGIRFFCHAKKLAIPREITGLRDQMDSDRVASRRAAQKADSLERDEIEARNQYAVEEFLKSLVT